MCELSCHFSLFLASEFRTHALPDSSFLHLLLKYTLFHSLPLSITLFPCLPQVHKRVDTLPVSIVPFVSFFLPEFLPPLWLVCAVWFRQRWSPGHSPAGERRWNQRNVRISLCDMDCFIIIIVALFYSLSFSSTESTLRVRVRVRCAALIAIESSELSRVARMFSSLLFSSKSIHTLFILILGTCPALEIDHRLFLSESIDAALPRQRRRCRAGGAVLSLASRHPQASTRQQCKCMCLVGVGDQEVSQCVYDSSSYFVSAWRVFTVRRQSLNASFSHRSL